MTSKIRKIFNLIIIILILTTTISTAATTTIVNPKLMDVVRDMVAQWYFIFRYFSIALMLVVLIYLGIKLAISSIAEDKAKYKRMLIDWVVGFIIIFVIHYYMILIIKLNETCVDLVKRISEGLAEKFVTGEEAALGLSPTTQGLYEMVRTRAYELRFSIGTSGMIMYMVLVYYTIKFIFIYFKRFFTILILTILAPLMGLFYAFNKIMSGKGATFKKWASEYAFNVFLQTIHAITYGIFVTLAIGLSSHSIAGFVLAMVMLNFMDKSEKILRKIFKLSGGLLDDNANKGIKENLAAATAMKASLGAVFGTQIAKNIGNGAKNLIGGVASFGVRSGMTAYDKGVDKLLEDKKKKKEEEEEKLKKERLDKTKSEKERLEKEKETKDRIAKLDASIKKLEKKQEAKNKRLKGYRGGIKDPKKLEEYIEEQTKGIYDPELKRKEEQRIRENNEKIILKRVKTKNQMTGKTEITGVGTLIKGNINKAIWGNSEVKSGVKDLFQTTAKGISGAIMTMASIPLIVTEPAAGLALLAKGRKNANKLFKNNDYRKATNFSERRAIEAGQRKLAIKNQEKINKNKKVTKKKKRVLRTQTQLKNKSRRYSFNRFNPRSLETIKSQMLMKFNLNAIRNMNSLSLKNISLTLPFRLTGTLGALRTIQSKAYKIQEARKDYFENVETFMTLEKKDSISKDFVSGYNAKVDGIVDKVNSRSNLEVMQKYGEDSGQIVKVGNTSFKFGEDLNAPKTTQDIKTSIIDNALLKVAARNKVLDIRELNLKNNKIQTELSEEFRKLGVLNDTVNPENFEIDKTKELNIDKLEERIKIISKNNPKAVEETIAKEVIVDYMERNVIEDENEVKKEEHKEKIIEEFLEILDEQEKMHFFEEETENTNTQEIDSKMKILEDAVKSHKKGESLGLLDDLISGLKTYISDTDEDIIPKEVVAEERKRQVEIEKMNLDEQLQGFEKIINDDLDDTEVIEDYIENKVSPDVDELLAQLLALKEQDMAGIALNFKTNSYEQKKMNSIDMDRINSTYKKKL